MRDIIILLLTFAGSVNALTRPWIGVLWLAVFTYLNPHRYAWGFSRSLPCFTILFVATVVGMVLHADERRPFPWTRETKVFLLLLGWFTFTTFFHPDYPIEARLQWEKVMKVYLGI